MAVRQLITELIIDYNMKKILSLIVLLAGVTMLMSCGDDDATYNSIQKLEVSNAEVLFEAEGGTGSITVNTSSGVTATTESTWLTVAANGNKVTVTAPLNSSLDGRSATITLKAGDAQAVVTATQKGSVYGIAGGLDYTLADAPNSSIAVPVVHTSAVVVKSLSDWLTATFNTETNQIEIVAAANDAETTREGYVAFETGIIKDTLTIVQDAFVFEVGTDSIAMPTEGGVQKVGIKHSRTVTLATDADWITCKLDTKTDTIEVTVDKNEGEARMGVITVKTSQFEKTIKIYQEEKEPDLPLWGTYTFYWVGNEVYNLGDFTIEEYTGEDAEEGDIILRGFYVPGNEVWGFLEDGKLYLYANQALGILNDPNEGDYGNILQSTSGQDYIEFDITPDGIITKDLRVIATDPGYTQGWWWEIPAGGTTVFARAEEADASRSAIKGGFKNKSRKNIPTNIKLYHKK